MPYIIAMIFIETSLFTRLIQDYLADEEYAGLQHFLVDNPESGAVIPKSGGVRKLRWFTRGKGKRGGIRVIYYWKKSDHEMWMLTVYSKREKENIPAHILRKIAEEIKDV